MVSYLCYAVPGDFYLYLHGTVDTAFFASFVVFADGARLYSTRPDGLELLAVTLSEFPSRYHKFHPCASDSRHGTAYLI